MKGVALIDGRSRPYFQGIERVLNSQQREALAQGVWQVLETIPDDFESFEFQFAGTQVYIHKLSQEQILLVLTHDNLIYPDYFDAFSRLREAFKRDSSVTMDVFQRLLGARNAKATPLNLNEVANRETSGLEQARNHGAIDPQADGSQGSTPQAAPAPPAPAAPRESTLAQELPTLEIPSGSADYAVAADTEITDVSMAAVEPDAPANPAASTPALAEAAEKAADNAEDLGNSAENLPNFGAIDFDVTEAGLPDLGEVDTSLPTVDSPAPVAETAVKFEESLTDANALLGRGSAELAEQSSTELATAKTSDDEPLLAVTPSPEEDTAAKAGAGADPQADLAALMDTLSLGEDDFESQITGATIEDNSASDSAAVQDELPAPTLPDLGFDDAADPSSIHALPEMGATRSETPWEESASPASEAVEAIAAESRFPNSATAPPKLQQESLLSVTRADTSALPGHSAQAAPQAKASSTARPDGSQDSSPDNLLNNRLDAVALDEGIEIDELFGYEEPIADAATSQEATAVLESYVDSLNALGEFSAHYLGRAVIVNYWRTSRPSDEWLKGAFAIERSANSIRLGPDYAASRRSPVTAGQQAALQAWAEQFMNRCSKVIRDFPHLAQQSLSETQSSLLDL